MTKSPSNTEEISVLIGMIKIKTTNWLYLNTGYKVGKYYFKNKQKFWIIIKHNHLKINAPRLERLLST